MAFEINHTRARDLLEYFKGRRGEVLSLARALVETESPTGDAEGSRAVVRLLVQAAEAIGSVNSVERIPATNNFGEHLRLRAFDNGASEARTLLILGHTDTVHPRGTLAQRPWREEDGKIYGPGVFDMKTGCALVLEVLRALSALSLTPSRPVVLLLTCDEETGSQTGRYLVREEAPRADAVLVLEPPAPGGRAKTERKGTSVYELKVQGRASHAGLEPEKGISAVRELARQIERLYGMQNPATGTTINVGVIDGGTQVNVVAAEARAEVEVRFTTMKEAERMHETIMNLSPIDERARLSITGDMNRPPMERTAAAAKLYEHARGIAAAFDFELDETSVGGASDGNFAAACGAPVLDGLGIDGDGAHATHEHILADAIVWRGALLAALIASL